jgi:ATP-binding cassette, subfamily F, member 2
MTGELMPTEGDVKRHSHLSIAKYHQHSVDALIPELTVIEFFQVPPLHAPDAPWCRLLGQVIANQRRQPGCYIYSSPFA